MSQDQKKRDDLFTSFKDLETQLATCVAKAKFIEGIVNGTEPVTFVLIDRCRETVLQARQAKYVFDITLAKIGSAAEESGEETTTRLRSLSEEIKTASDKASADMDIIVSWVPAAPNTRRFG
jgi:hypothetical protein